MSFDPKLRAAMKEIEAVCAKYDCGGHVSLVSPTHGEFRFVLPQWSRIRLLPKGNSHAWHVKLHAHSVAMQEFLSLEKLIEIIKQNVDVEHTPFADYEPFHHPEGES